VEFAVVSSLASTLLMGSAECAKYFMTVESVRAAAGEAVRTATLRGGANRTSNLPGCQGMTGSISGLTTSVRFLESSRLTSNLYGCTTHTSGVSTVNVTLTYQYTFTIPIFGQSSEVITETARAIFN
jgi:Flp pilus assembly protein TadG